MRLARCLGAERLALPACAAVVGAPLEFDKPVRRFHAIVVLVNLRTRTLRTRARFASSRRTLLVAATAALLCVGGGIAAWITTPQITSHTPAVGTDRSTTMVVLFLRHAPGLRAHHIHATVNGVDVSKFARVADDEVHLELAGLADGDHDIRVWSERFGLLHRRFDTRWSFLVDTTVPTIKLTTPSDRLLRSDVRNTRFRLHTEPGARITFISNGHETIARADADGQVSSLVPLDEGRRLVTIEARDSVGNTASAWQRVFVDSIAPRLRFALPPVQRRIEWRAPATASDTNAVTLTAAVDGDDTGLTLSKTGIADEWVVSPTHRLAEGNHVIELTATDPSGHATSVRQTVLVDSSEQLGENALGRGARGADVRALHQRLRELKFFSPASGAGAGEWRGRRYGAATAAGVRRFQESKALTADGVAGDDTVAAMTLRIVINRATHTLTLFNMDRVEKVYGVAVGQPAYPTPTGEFRIVNKAEDPTWTPPLDSEWAKDAKPIAPGPDNPLGTRWMGLDAPNVGIHGTNSPTSIGYSVSHGCIRMAIPDVEDLFDRVQIGTPVQIVA